MIPIAADIIKTSISAAKLLKGGSDMPAKHPRGVRFDKLGNVRQKRAPSARLMARNAIVMKVKKERGVSLMEASKIVKKENLWT